MIQQLNPPLYVVTPFGDAIAHFIFAHSTDAVWYGCFQNATGENWWWQNPYVRLCQNFSDDRANLSPIALPPELEERLRPHKERHEKAAAAKFEEKADKLKRDLDDSIIGAFFGPGCAIAARIKRTAREWGIAVGDGEARAAHEAAAKPPSVPLTAYLGVAPLPFRWLFEEVR